MTFGNQNSRWGRKTGGTNTYVKQEIRTNEVKTNNVKAESIGALWQQVSRSGNTYYKGTIDGKKVIVYVNSNATPENRQPTLRIYEDIPDAKVTQEVKRTTPKAEKPVYSNNEEQEYSDLPEF